jgi:Glycosyltransferase
MKIAILSPFYPYRGGIARFSDRLYRELENSGNEIKAFSFKRLYPGFLFPGKTQFVEDVEVAGSHAKQILDSINPLSWRKTAKAIEAYQPDVLIIAYWMPFFAKAFRTIAKRQKGKTKIVVLTHNAIPHEPRLFDKNLTRLFFKQADSFIALSDAVMQDILAIRPDANITLKSHPLYDDYGEAIPPKEARKQLNIDLDRKTLLFFGLIRDYKGLDILIDTMAELGDDYQLVIAGECYGSFDKYQQQIEASPAKERIKVINQYISDKDIPPLFSAADLLVLPYRSATQSGVIPLAYYYELPIVATDVGSLKETVAQAGTGIITQPEPRAIARAIKQYFSASTEEYKANIRKERERLSWERFVEEGVSKCVDL